MTGVQTCALPIYGYADKGFVLQLKGPLTRSPALVADQALVYSGKDFLVIDTGLEEPLLLFRLELGEAKPAGDALEGLLESEFRDRKILSFIGFGLAEYTFIDSTILNGSASNSAIERLLRGCDWADVSAANVLSFYNCSGLECHSGGPGSTSCSTSCLGNSDSCSVSCSGESYSCCDREVCQCRCCSGGPE